MKPLGDRRSCVRLDVVGLLWGTLGVARQARVVNLSRYGALVTCPVPVPPDTATTIQLTLANQDIRLEARVRHITPAPDVDGNKADYAIGLEFLDDSAVLARVLG